MSRKLIINQQSQIFKKTRTDDRPKDILRKISLQASISRTITNLLTDHAKIKQTNHQSIKLHKPQLNWA